MKKLNKELKNQIIKEAKEMQSFKMDKLSDFKSRSTFKGLNLNKIESLLKKKLRDLEKEYKRFKYELQKEEQTKEKGLEI